MNTTVPVSVVVARAIHRALILCVAPAVRRAYRDEMIATFAAASEEAGRRGCGAVWRLLWNEARDLMTANRANRTAGVPAAGGPTPAARLDSLRIRAWIQAWRSLRRRPAFFTAAVLTLAIGAGVTTAIFALVDTVLIKPLPFPDGDQLVTVFETSPQAKERTSLIAPARLADWQRLNTTFVALSGSYNENVTDTSGDNPERLEARRVAPRFFDVFAMPPRAGRFFLPAEELPEGPGAAIISDGFWQRRFNRAPAAVGRTLTIGGKPFAIVGIMPPAFSAATTDVWLPAQTSPGLMQVRDARFMTGVGRLKPGVAIEAGARDLAGVQAGLAKEFPKTDGNWSSEIGSLKQARIGTARDGLVLVLAAVAALWAIAVANIAGLTLVQVHRRSRELMIRTALGGSRARVVGTVLREGLLIAAIGGGLGAALAAWIIAAMPAILTRTPRMNELALDGRGLAFIAATSVLGACVFSLVPAISATRRRAGGVTTAGGRSVAGGKHALQKLLVVGQVALSVLLVGSATLLLRSYYNLTRVDTGFDAADVVKFHVGARWDEDRVRIGTLQLQLMERLRQLPHVQSAGYTNFLPTSGATLRYSVTVEGLTGTNADGSMTTGVRMIGGNYLETLKAPLMAGAFCPAVAADFSKPAFAVVNQRFIDQYAERQNLVGRQLKFAQDGNAVFTISGVVANVAEDTHKASPVPYVYTCNAPGSWPDPEYVVRTRDAGALQRDLRNIVRDLAPARAIFGFRPLAEVIDAGLDQPRLDVAMLATFAGAALLLATIGLYSLFTLVVAERAREMAVRLAIGAAPREMVRLVMAGAGRLLAIGLLAGVLLTAGADRLLRGVLFGVEPLDAPALAAAAALLALVAMAAVALPAIRASRISPIEALRGE
ncbi:MAG TPA: ADOP family duplicated permease [Vicinamibacterales bacterium]|nr:ADOP family duplicated permease [Vicinamibacterales bacterium]